MNILGVDPGTTTGLALAVSGQITSSIAVTCKTEDYVQRGIHLADQMVTFWQERLRGQKPDLVVIEGYAYGQTRSLATMVALGTVLRVWCIVHGVCCLTVAPSSLKKFILGTGRGKKEDVKLALYKRFGIEVPSHDEADAVCLALFGAYVVQDLEENLPKNHLDPVIKVRKSVDWRALQI